MNAYKDSIRKTKALLTSILLSTFVIVRYLLKEAEKNILNNSLRPSRKLLITHDVTIIKMFPLAWCRDSAQEELDFSHELINLSESAMFKHAQKLVWIFFIN